MKTENIFTHIPADKKDEFFEILLSNESVTIERIISNGHCSPPAGWYDQEKNEWVMVLKGKAILVFENEAAVRLGEGDYINIPAHTRHKVEWTDPHCETIWLAIWY